MTATDGAAEHSVPADFVYYPTYDAHLTHLAETDEIPAECDWPALRTAIKFKIQSIVASFPENPQPLLHPVARFNALQSSRLGQRGKRAGAGAGTGVANGNGSSADGEAVAAAESSSRSSSSSSAQRIDASPSAAAAGLSSRFSPASTSDDADVQADMDMAAPSAPTTDAAGDTSSASASASASADSSTDAPLDPAAVGVTEVDFSGFYPAKTQPPPSRGGSWGRRLTPAEMQMEVGMVFSMLDDFDVSPPFTIQRLAELLLSPRAYVRSAPKFLSSLTRILAMTASHADFPPVSPGQPPVVNGYHPGGGSVFEGQRMTGPPSPNSEPLFSPIPFLQRPGSTAADVPHLNLEGAGAGAGAFKEEKGDGDGVADTSNDSTDDATKVAVTSTAPPPEPVSLESSSSSSEDDQGAQQVKSEPTPPPPAPAPAAEPSTSSSSASSSGPTTDTASVPLGVPPGRVDELDSVKLEGEGAPGTAASVPTSADGQAQAQVEGTTTHHMDGALRPLSSTTTAPAELTSTAKGEASAMEVDVDAAGEREEEKREQREGRSHKRMKSEDFRVDEGAGAGPGAGEEVKQETSERQAGEAEAEAEAAS